MFNPIPVRERWCNNEESIQEFLCTSWLLCCFSFISLGEISLSLCLSASLNVCASILTSLLFFVGFLHVFFVWRFVFPLDLYEMTRRPPVRNVTLFEEVLADTCVLHYFVLLSVTAFLLSHLHEAFLLFSSRCLLHLMHNTKRVTRRNAQVRFHSKLKWKNLTLYDRNKKGFHSKTFK